MPLDAELLNILACPRCRGELTLQKKNDAPAGLECPACAVVYPIEEDIPVLLIEEAVPADQWKKDNA